MKGVRYIMQDYKILADSYKTVIEREAAKGNDITDLQSDLKAFEYLAECNNDDIESLFNSGAFNDICKAYLSYSLKAANVDNEKIKEVMNEFNAAIDMMQAGEILQREGYKR